jgi:hypothetical protein
MVFGIILHSCERAQLQCCRRGPRPYAGEPPRPRPEIATPEGRLPSGRQDQAWLGFEAAERPRGFLARGGWRASSPRFQALRITRARRPCDWSSKKHARRSCLGETQAICRCGGAGCVRPELSARAIANRSGPRDCLPERRSSEVTVIARRGILGYREVDVRSAFTGCINKANRT